MFCQKILFAAGGSGGNVSINNTNGWQNIVSTNGANGGDFPSTMVENTHWFYYEKKPNKYSWDIHPDLNPYTPPNFSGSGATYVTPGGSPNGGKGLVRNNNNNIKLGGDAYLKLEWFYNIPDPIEITNWTDATFNQTYQVPDYTYLKVTAKSKGGDGGIATHGNGNENYYLYSNTFTFDMPTGQLIQTLIEHRYIMGSGGGGGADFEGEYYGNEINIQKNGDIITLNFNNKQIELRPGGDGGNNSGTIPLYTIAGGIGGNVNIPTDNDEWLNIVTNNGQSGSSTTSLLSETTVEIFTVQAYDGTTNYNYTPPDVNNSYHIAGGSPRGGRGVVGGTIGEPNATLRGGGDAYLKLEWIENLKINYIYKFNKILII